MWMTDYELPDDMNLSILRFIIVTEMLRYLVEELLVILSGGKRKC